MIRLLSACVLVVLALSENVVAQDLAGGKDHPLISRYAGAVLNAYLVEEYAELEIVRAEKASGNKFGSSAGGKLTSLNYLTPAGRTALEVFRSYQKAMADGGFRVLHRCELDACKAERRLTGQGSYASEVFAERMSGQWAKAAPSIEWTDNPSYFLSAQLKRSQGDVYVLLWVTPGYAGALEASVFQFVLEEKPADTGLVTVNAAALEQAVNKDGRIALYDIHFDSGSAVLKSTSDAQIGEMAKLLQRQAGLKVFIVGHTDNQGGFEKNKQLSLQRAEAVIQQLVRIHKIDQKRLLAQGVANVAPVASNANESGRAKNRRVELVAQ